MYVDGVYVASDFRASTSVALLGGIANVRMGARAPPNIYDRSPWTPYKGKLDDVRLYTRVLNDAEIATMFATARNPWTVNMKLLQLSNGSYIYVELSADGVDAQCWGSNGVCLIGASESDLLSAASVTTMSLSDRVRCGSELQNITGDTGYTTGLTHWCAQASVFLKGTTTTETTTSITVSTTQTSATLTVSLTTTALETTTQGQTSTTQGETSTTQGQTSTALVGQTSTALVTTTAGSPPAATTTRAATTTFASNPGAVACSNA